MIAGRYTLLEQPAAEVMRECARRGTRVVIASVFNSGLLASPAGAGRYEYGDAPDSVRDKLQRILAVCRAHDVSLPAAAVQFPFRHPATAAVVVASSRPEQVRQNVAYARTPIPEEFWTELAEGGLTC